MAMELMYITNDPKIALIAEKAGVDRIWIDLETLGKEERQKGLNTVKSHHTIEDIKIIKPLLTKSKMMVRVNPWNINSQKEINKVLDAGAEYIMLPMWKSPYEVQQFIKAINKRAKTILLLETKEAELCLDEVLKINGIDEIHIGLNDLHLSKKIPFMFQLLGNGNVDEICKKIMNAGISYGFGGVSHLGDGMIPAEMILKEHYRLKSSRVILSRGFCNINQGYEEIEKEFTNNLKEFREYENMLCKISNSDLEKNHLELAIIANNIGMKKKGTQYLKLREEFGDAFYLLDSRQFRENFKDLKTAFARYYPNFNIAYSYKTNYTPEFCKIINELHGYAEVVSEMELELALKVGVIPTNIIWNGPVKNNECLKRYLLMGVVVNIDNLEELNMIKEFVLLNSNTVFNIGIRCNFDVNDGVISRFGFDVYGNDFDKALAFIKSAKNVNFVNFQCHFAKRNIEYWPNRAKGMISLIDRVGIIPKRIDIGGGLFGYMPPELKSQFNSYIPSYDEYASKVATLFAERFTGDDKPELIIEPGSALVGDCMKFVGTVKNIKFINGKTYATVLGSQKNISMGGVNPPINVINFNDNAKFYSNVDLVGFTCIEGDVLYHGYSGKLSVGDMLEISNCGSYSIVMKPPFILPNFPIIDISNGDIKLIKQKETFDDIFHTFVF